MTTPEIHAQRSDSIEASLGIPCAEFCDAYGPLLVPYLAPSWREIRLIQALASMQPEEQTQALYLMIQRRLPDLSFEEFEDITGPDHFAAWWIATRPPRAGEVGGGEDPTTGRAHSRPSPYSSLLSSGSTRR